jgi:hypothetical protein
LRRLARALEVSTHTHWFYYFFFFSNRQSFKSPVPIKCRHDPLSEWWPLFSSHFFISWDYYVDLLWHKTFSQLKKECCFAITVTPVARPAL